jgi:hypothetical protein
VFFASCAKLCQAAHAGPSTGLATGAIFYALNEGVKVGTCPKKDF